jgi:hypothetical protein
MDQSWSQPFNWGVLMAFDVVAQFESPTLSRDGAVQATTTCLSVPVLHAQDIEMLEGLGPGDPLPQAEVQVTVKVSAEDLGDAEFACLLSCPSGRLQIGDAEAFRVVDVPKGDLRVQVRRHSPQFAEAVVLHITGSAAV